MESFTENFNNDQQSAEPEPNESGADHQEGPDPHAKLKHLKKVFGTVGDQPRFGLWRMELRNDPKQKEPYKTKVPYNAMTGKRAKPNDPGTWCSFDRAVSVLTEHPGMYSGLAVFLGPLGDDPVRLVGVDLDVCRSPVTGMIETWAEEWILDIGSYAEISPSGTGVKILALYDGPIDIDGERRSKSDKPKESIEIKIDSPVPEGAEDSGHASSEIAFYGGGRFFALTGEDLNGLSVVDATEAIDEGIDHLIRIRDERKGDKKKPGGRPSGGSAGRYKTYEPGELPASIKRLLEEDSFFADQWHNGGKLTNFGDDESASGLDFALAVYLHRKGVPFNPDFIQAFKCYPHGQVASGKLTQPHEIAHRLRSIEADVFLEPVTGSFKPDGRPEFKLAGGKLHKTVQFCQERLGELGDIYQRAGQLVRIARQDSCDKRVRRSKGALTIVPYEVPTMRTLLTEGIKFKRFDKRANDWFPADCPSDVADIMIRNVGNWPSVPGLIGIVEHPTLRPDGSILDRPGYDEDSQLYFDNAGAVFPDVPDQPTREQALAALDTIKRVISGFPFASDEDRSVWISALFGVLVRRSIRAAPMTVFTAPKMGSGKTLLATCLSYVATGRPPAMISQTEDEESERKRLLSVLLAGDNLVVIDNVERPIKSHALCTILTEENYDDRILGVSQMVKVPTCVSWAVTGNNVIIAGDLTTRTLLCRIDPDVERPEERRFDVNLHQYVPAHRAELAVAALTIIRGYIAAGSPDVNVKPFGRFEEWQEFCRFPLIWLGEPDPCLTRAAIEMNDPSRELLGRFLEAWFSEHGEQALTLKTAMDRADADMKEIMKEIGRDGTEPSAKKVGFFLTSNMNRFENGMCFKRGERTKQGYRWMVERKG